MNRRQSTGKAHVAQTDHQETGGGNAVPIYEAIAKEIFKGKPPTPFRHWFAAGSCACLYRWAAIGNSSPATALPTRRCSTP